SHEPFAVPGWDGCLLSVRAITDWGPRREIDRQLGKREEFFLLTRDPLPGEEMTGGYPVSARGGVTADGASRAHRFRLNSRGSDLSYDLTSRTQPTGDPETGFKRHIAILFDGQVMSAPTLNEPIRRHGQITGEFTQQEVADFVRILGAGALPVRFKLPAVRR